MGANGNHAVVRALVAAALAFAIADILYCNNFVFGLNKDMDWGSYCIMGGWVMGFVPALLMNEGVPESWYFNDFKHK